MNGAAPAARQLVALTRTFLASVFDNDLTANSHDRKETFIWLMGLLAAPGFIFPITLAGSSMSIIGQMAGADVVRDLARDYKVIYFGLGMVATGLVSALVWNQLLVDRRDAQILGVLPVRPTTVTAAKLLSVVIYVVVVTVVMHLPASLTFGVMLAADDAGRILPGAAAHFVASGLAGAFVLFAVLAVQSVLVLIAGTRRAARLSTVTLVTLVAAMLLLLVSTPGMGAGVKREMQGADARAVRSGFAITPAAPEVLPGLSPWLEASPPVWFFGVAEAMVGTNQPVIINRMATRGVVATGLVVLVTLVGFPLACRRLLTSAISEPSGFGRTGWTADAFEALARAMTRVPAGRAVVTLVTTTAGRLPRQRLIAAAAFGASIAVALPVLISAPPIGAAADRGSVELLALPFYLSVFLLVGLRLIIRSPGELGAGWLLAMADVPVPAIVVSIRRLFLVACVASVLIVFTPFYWSVWGPAVALTQALLVAATGALVATALLFRWSSMPCATLMGRLDQGRAGRQVVLGFLVFTWITTLPAAIPILARAPIGLAILLGVVGLATLAIRLAERSMGPLPQSNLYDVGPAFDTLGLTGADLDAGATLTQATKTAEDRSSTPGVPSHVATPRFGSRPDDDAGRAPGQASRWGRSKVGALTHTFLARFFDNEITAGTNDLKTSFFWLIAFLAVPGLMMPWFQAFNWTGAYFSGGAEGLRTMARADKLMYVGFGMAATGFVAAIVWNALLVDRRDALVLGVLPVETPQIVRAKLLALLAYTAIVNGAMHLMASLSFGFFLAVGQPMSFALRGAVAHFVASCMAGGFVLMFVAAVQGTALVTLGPRLFRRISPVLQVGLVATALGGLIALPTISLAINPTLRGASERAAPWVLNTPPAWFLGVYEWVLGTSDPMLRSLAATGLLATAAAAALVVISYPLSCRRVTRAAIVDQASGRRRAASARLAAALTRRIGRDAAGRAAVQFLLATLGRSERHRFAAASALGLVVAICLPAGLQWLRLAQEGTLGAPPVPLLSLPLAAMVCLLVGLRIVYSLPSDLKATWLFVSASPPAARVHAALRRFAVIAVIVPVFVVYLPAALASWEAPVVLTHTLLGILVGAVIAEGLLFRASGMPCSRPWRPEGASLRVLWLPYLLAFAVVTQGVSSASIHLATRPVTLGVVASGLAAAWFWLAFRSTPSSTASIADDDAHLQVLNLS